MNHEEFQRLIYPFMDEELDAAKHHEVEVYLENSAEARAIFDYETRLRTMAREALNTPADMVAKGRLLANFRDAVGDSGASEPVANRRVAGNWAWQVPVAAAALFMVAWLGGIFDRSTGIEQNDIREDNPSSVLIDVVNVSEGQFRKKVAKESKEHDCRFRQVKGCLDPSDSQHYWPANSQVPQNERLAACSRMVSKCMKKKTVLPCLPKHFSLVAARKAQLKFKDRAIVVPHIIMMTEDESLSVYVICDSQAEEISRGLHEISRSKKKDACLLGCPQRGVVVTECQGVWLVLISEMSFNRLQSLAEGI